MNKVIQNQRQLTAFRLRLQLIFPTHNLQMYTVSTGLYIFLKQHKIITHKFLYPCFSIQLVTTNCQINCFFFIILIQIYTVSIVLYILLKQIKIPRNFFTHVFQFNSLLQKNKLFLFFIFYKYIQ